MTARSIAWAKMTCGHNSAAQKLLLLVLADYYREDEGISCPPETRLAADCEVSPRTIRRGLAALERAGFITTTSKGNQYRPSAYQLNFDTLRASTLDKMSGAKTSDKPDLSGAQEGAEAKPDNEVDNLSMYGAALSILREIEGYSYAPADEQKIVDSLAAQSINPASAGAAAEALAAKVSYDPRRKAWVARAGQQYKNLLAAWRAWAKRNTQYATQASAQPQNGAVRGAQALTIDERRGERNKKYMEDE